MRIILFSLFLLISVLDAQAALKVQKIADNIYALVGELSQRSAENYGNNSTHGVIVTDEGVILIDSGGSYLGAKEIHETIQSITDKHIKIVINSGGQDHRWFGNDYFKKLGARIIASKAAMEDQIEREDGQFERMSNLIGDSIKGTEIVYATEVFEDKTLIELGGIKLELYYLGPAHTLGDIVIWLPDNKIMFGGDIVFNDRMLGVGPARNIESWIEVFEAMANFKPELVVPGHGNPSDLQKATQDTYNYLVLLRSKITEVLENDGTMFDAVEIDQSEFSYLENFESIAKRNAGWAFEIMEFDF